MEVLEKELAGSRFELLFLLVLMFTMFHQDNSNAQPNFICYRCQTISDIYIQNSQISLAFTPLFTLVKCTSKSTVSNILFLFASSFRYRTIPFLVFVTSLC